MATNVYYGKNGKLMVMDSTKGRDLSQSGPKEVHVSNEVGGVHNNVTANMLNPSSGTVTILALNTDRFYVGQAFRILKVDVELSSPASADGGALVGEYWDGSAWQALPNLRDGTAVGGNTMQQSGKLQWSLPMGWVANDPPATGTNLFYVRFRTTNSTATDAVALLIEPSSGQFVIFPFVNMNATGPEGRNRPDEIIKLNRGQLDLDGSYIQGLDDPVVEPMTITWTCLIVDAFKLAAPEALQCGNPALAGYWTKDGISTKGDSQIPAGLPPSTLFNTPLFTDPRKKTVCVQMEWTTDNGNTFREYNEVWFNPSQQSLNEAADGVTMNISGLVYGSIRTDLEQLGYRF